MFTVCVLLLVISSDSIVCIWMYSIHFILQKRTCQNYARMERLVIHALTDVDVMRTKYATRKQEHVLEGDVRRDFGKHIVNFVSIS